MALFGFLAVAPALLAQKNADDVGEDLINDIFMEASEGTPPPPPPAAESIPEPPTAPPAAESVPPVIDKVAGKPPRHAPPEPASPPKKAGKPPLAAAGNDLPTAVLEPEPAAAPPPEAAPPSETTPPAGTEERPLPVPPDSGADAPPESGGDEYFLGPDELGGGQEAGTEGAAPPMDLGTLPSLPWEMVDPNAPAANFISDSPLPQFDSSESNWKQMEIGQADVQEPPPPPERPASVPSVTEPEPEAAPPPGPATDREYLRSLFNDMLPPPSQGARPPAQSPPAVTPAPPLVTAAEAEKGEPGPAPAEALTTPAGGPEDGGPEVQESDYVGGSAILRAGGQLTVEGHFGGAAILPPLEGAPSLAAWMEAQKAGDQEGSPGEGPAADPSPKTSAGEGAKPGAAASGAAPAKPRAKPTAPVVRSQLTLINETGDERMLEIYRSVLSQMGYTIVSVETRPPAVPPTGQTIISYRPGLRARARAVAAHLPGRKTLVEAPAGLATEISILLR